MSQRNRLTHGWRSLPAMLAATSVTLGAASASAQQAERAATVVVIDGSNSMNARLPGDRAFKFVTVREALKASLPGIAGTEVGLAAFGHRRASDCNDAEVIVQPTADASRVAGALDRFQPRGFSPVVLAVRNAARALPAGVGKASIVLVLDDLASCRGEDPCAVAADLKRQNPALAIHVVVLGPRPVDLPVLACMVRQTGGQLFQVSDGPGVAPAIAEAMKLAGRDRRQAPVATSAAAAVTTAAAPMAAARRAAPPGLEIDLTRPGLHLTARLNAGGPALLVPVVWQIWRAGSERSEAAPLVEATAPALSHVLPNGRYDVEATAGLVKIRRSIEITSQGPTPVTIDLDAALLAIAAPSARGAASIPDTTLTVSAIGATADAKEAHGAPLWIGRGGRHDLVVPAGSYRVTAAAGLAQAVRVVTAGAGIAAEVDVALNAGRLVLDPGAPGSAGDDTGAVTQFVLETDDPDGKAGRRELHRAVGRRLDLAVPAGSYLMTMRRDGAELRERYLLKPGDTLSRPVMLPVARVRFAGRLGNAGTAGLPAAYRVERLDAPFRVLQRWGEAEPVIELSPGRYRVEARLGAQNAVAVREVDLRAAAGEQRLDLDTGAGRVQLKLAGENAGLGLGEVYWQILTEQGVAVWRTGQPEPVIALLAGRYIVRVSSRERSHERAVDVRVGDNGTIEVGG